MSTSPGDDVSLDCGGVSFPWQLVTCCGRETTLDSSTRTSIVCGVGAKPKSNVQRQSARSHFSHATCWPNSHRADRAPHTHRTLNVQTHRHIRRNVQRVGRHETHTDRPTDLVRMWYALPRLSLRLASLAGEKVSFTYIACRPAGRASKSSHFKWMLATAITIPNGIG